jgi:hypothetical protein
MDSEEVVFAEVQEEGPHEEEEHLEGGGRRISAGPIIAVVVVVIILSGIGYYFLSGAQINDIIILDPEDLTQGDDQKYGIEVEIHITGGMRAVSGTGKLDITYDGALVHSREVKISDDKGKAEINYNEFVMENGVYDIRFTMDGKSASSQYIAKMVPDELNITFQYQTDPDTDEIVTMAVISPEFTYADEPDKIVIGDSIFYYSWNYDLETTLTRPEGEPIVTKQSMWDYHRNKTYTKVWLPVEGDYMGNYSFAAKLVNNLVRPDSELKELSSTPGELRTYLNRAPVLGEISKPSRVRVDQEVSFTLRADDPDANGAITYYTVTWDYALNLDDDNDTVSQDLEMFEVPPGGSTTLRIRHTFTETGTYSIAITCADNGYIKYTAPNVPDPNVNYQKYDTDIITIVVTIF